MFFKNRYEEPTLTYNQTNLLFHIRNLWRELATWTRAYMITKNANLEIADYVFERLYKVLSDFADALSMFLGNQTAEQFMKYLSVQLILTKELIDAQVAGNTVLVNEIFQQLFHNADERAKFMASVNPFWNESVIKSLIYNYHTYTLQEIRTLLTEEYQKNIDIFDIILKHTDNMGDYLTQGLFNYMNYNPQNNLQA